MRNIALLLLLASAAWAAEVIPGDASKGAELFSSLRCVNCHGVNGQGGNLAPDLGKRAGRDFTPSRLAGLMWNHAPTMWNAMEKAGIGGYFDEIVDRDETYYAKEQGIYYLYRKHRPKHMRVVLLSGTSAYLKAGNNANGCKVGDTYLEVLPVALATEHAYNDEETLRAAKPKAVIRSFDELLPALRELAPLG